MSDTYTALTTVDPETGITLTIESDSDLENPLDCDDAVIVCILSRTKINPAERHGIHTLEQAQAFCEANEEAETPEWVIFPVFGYDHGNVIYKASESGANPFSCQWDSGRAGWIALNVNEVGHEHFKGAENVLKSYTAWANGEGFGYKITDAHGDELDACWGYLGDYDESGCLEEGRSAFTSYVESAKADAKALADAENADGAGV